MSRAISERYRAKREERRSSSNANKSNVSPFDVLGKGGVNSLDEARKAVREGRAEEIIKSNSGGSVQRTSTQVNTLNQGNLIPEGKTTIRRVDTLQRGNLIPEGATGVQRVSSGSGNRTNQLKGSAAQALGLPTEKNKSQRLINAEIISANRSFFNSGTNALDQKALNQNNFQRTGGSITADTSNKISRNPNPLFFDASRTNFVQDVKRGSSIALDTATFSRTTRPLNRGSTGELLGFSAAFIPSLAIGASDFAVTKTASAVTKTASATAKYGDKLLNPFIRGGGAAATTARGALTSTATALGINQGAKTTSRILAPQEQRIYLENQEFQKLLGQSLATETRAINRGGINIPFTNKKVSAKGIADELGIGLRLTNAVGERQVFERSVREAAREYGLNPDLAVQTALRERKTGELATTASFIGGGAVTERFGSRAIAQRFNTLGQQGFTVTKDRAFGKLALTTGAVIAPLGVAEGGTQEFIQQVNRRENISAKGIATEAAFGGVFAGALGGTIAATSVTSPKVSRVLQGGAYFTDPTELGGDILESSATRIQKNVFGQKIPEPSIRVRGGNTASLSFGTPVNTNQNKNIPSSPTRTRVRSISDFPQEIQRQFNIQNKRKTPRDSVTIPPLNLDGLTNTNTNIGVPIDNTINDPIINPENIINVKTKTNTNTPTFVNIPIPTVVAQAGILPPLPFSFPTGGSGGGSGKRGKRSTFRNELDAGLNILSRNLGVGLPTVLSPVSKVPKNTKRTSQPRNNFFGNQFDFLGNFGNNQKKRTTKRRKKRR